MHVSPTRLIVGSSGSHILFASMWVIDYVDYRVYSISQGLERRMKYFALHYDQNRVQMNILGLLMETGQMLRIFTVPDWPSHIYAFSIPATLFQLRDIKHPLAFITISLLTSGMSSYHSVLISRQSESPHDISLGIIYWDVSQRLLYHRTYTNSLRIRVQ
jgi:hypothetical protein